eukprot:CAMPEP_0185030190 /NCGR_PEP_ID=MMETSP1103-20130426/16982_1 /TAXON_ID=36769 /ORGANISM="Paraphysomonas bandaiensis, Strain Caron Lab Isolate" /LENGTH=406 /DNA_ID=CAMNT_0027565203 /DNA_START=93 /DNA_END=1313 /DNA_ORIENTATION=-
MAEMIGEGSFAVVKRTIYKPQQLDFASKIINIKKCLMRSGGADMLRGELKALKRITHHPFLCNLHFSYHDYTNCVLVLDLLEGGDLRCHLNSNFHFNEERVAFIAICLTSALHHIHSFGVIHRDIKPENILLDGEGYPRLTDFGVAHCNDSTSSGMVCTLTSGTFSYLAPEVLTSTHQHSFESDFWSLGVVMFEMLFMYRPFQRHCPKSFVTFVEEKYSHIWNSSRYLTDYTSTSANVTKISFDDADGALEEVAETVVSNASLPSDLVVFVPSVTPCNVPVTSEFRNIIHGLLDVRIPLRLGMSVQSRSLSKHPFFDVLKDSVEAVIRKRAKSPMIINVSVVGECIRHHFSVCTLAENMGRAYVISEEVQTILDNYTYTAPVYREHAKDRKTNSLSLSTTMGLIRN